MVLIGVADRARCPASFSLAPFFFVFPVPGSGNLLNVFECSLLQVCHPYILDPDIWLAVRELRKRLTWY